MCVCVCVCVMRCLYRSYYIWVNIVVADDLTPVWHQDIYNYHGDVAWSANILRELLATELHLWFELWRLIYHAYNMRTKPQSGDIQQPFLSYISGAVALKVPKTRHDASVKHGLTVRVHKHKL